jgi:Ni/Co efflux regulator RcnB
MRRIAVLIIAALAITVPVQAKSKAAKKTDPSQQEFKDQDSTWGHHTFSPAERNLIRAQLLSKESATLQQADRNLPPGLQKKVARGRTLPPGWQKKVTPGRSLDYHVYRQGESLPDSLIQRLPRPPVGTEILQIEDKVVLLNSATRNILDAFDLTPTR